MQQIIIIVVTGGNQFVITRMLFHFLLIPQWEQECKMLSPHGSIFLKKIASLEKWKNGNTFSKKKYWHIDVTFGIP